MQANHLLAMEAKLSNRKQLEGGVPTDEPFEIGGKTFYGRQDQTVGVLLLNARPEMGGVWETARGAYHVVSIQLPHTEHGRFVVHMAPGRPPSASAFSDEAHPA
jgi:hypothetical protein